MSRVPLFCLALVLAACAAYATRRPPEAPSGPPTLGLVVLVTVDQLRADMPLRMMARFGAGGFRRLYEEGVVYEQAHYAHSATETAVGHATLATGALPRDHGIVGNEWSERGLRVYSVDDAAHELVGASGKGKSPVRLRAETLGEVLTKTRSGALVRGVSEKERASILMNGRAGVAYWLDDGAASFVTSRFYAERLPRWAANFAAQRPAERYRKQQWELFGPASEYVAIDDRAWERGCALLGCVFPHTLGATSGPRFVHALKSTPFGDQLTLSFVRALLEAEPVGRDAVPDLLNVSFSSTDYVGHAFGPDSREAEDNLLRLDRTLAQLFELLDRRVGERRYVLLLSADHGVCESPEYFTAQGLDAGRVDPHALLRTVEAGLRERFGMGVELAIDFVNPSLVLHEQRIASLSLDLATVERAAAEIARAQPGVEAAFARSDLLAGTTPPTPFKMRLEHSTHPERSGHVYIVPKERWLLAARPETLSAMHGTPWPYDTHVPIVVWGTGVRAQRVRRPVDPRDIAPTLARVLRVAPPSASSGQPLVEALP